MYYGFCVRKEGRSPFYNVTGRVLMNMLPGKYTFRGVCERKREIERQGKSSGTLGREAIDFTRLSVAP